MDHSPVAKTVNQAGADVLVLTKGPQDFEMYCAGCTDSYVSTNTERKGRAVRHLGQREKRRAVITYAQTHAKECTFSA